MSEEKRIIFISSIKILRIFSSLPQDHNYGIDLHNIPLEWQESKGAGVKIAVIDTGLPNHHTIKDRIYLSANFSSDEHVEDRNGHSSHVSGIVAAGEDIGIAPESTLLIAKALGDDGSGTDQSIAQAITWVTENLDKNDIINMSLGGPSYFEMPQTYDAIKKAYNKGIHIICATGNENSDVGVPGRFDECIAVSAVDQDKKRAYFSNRGNQVDFAAAGVNIFSLGLNQTYARLSGTSMACPQIVGIAALLISAHKNNPGKLTPINSTEDLVSHLREISVDLGPCGKDVDFGYGIPIFSTNSQPPPPKPKQPSGNWFINFLRKFFTF